MSSRRTNEDLSFFFALRFAPLLGLTEMFFSSTLRSQYCKLVSYKIIPHIVRPNSSLVSPRFRPLFLSFSPTLTSPALLLLFLSSVLNQSRHFMGRVAVDLWLWWATTGSSRTATGRESRLSFLVFLYHFSGLPATHACALYRIEILPSSSGRDSSTSTGRERDEGKSIIEWS